MKISKLFKIWECTTTKDLRTEFCRIFFKDGYAYATDGHVLVKISVLNLFHFEKFEDMDAQLQLLEGMSISAELYKKAAMYSSDVRQLTITKEGFKYSDYNTSIIFGFSESPKKNKYPDILIEFIKEKTDEDDDPDRKIAFINKYIIAASHAMATDQIQLVPKIGGLSKVVPIEPVDELDAQAWVTMLYVR